MAMSEHKWINVGFWPQITLYNITAQERRYLPEKVAEMERQNQAARANCLAAFQEARDPSWKKDHMDEYMAVVAYLSNPNRYEGYRGFSTCRICGKMNGSRDHFRGPFRYPQGYLHYIIDHDVKPPQSVIDAAMEACGNE